MTIESQMTFDLILERIRKLPRERQEAIADQIDGLLEEEETGASVLTDAQWAKVEAALAEKNEPVVSHEALFARLAADDE